MEATARQLAFEEITAEGFDAFWQRDSREINPARAMGKHRFIVLNGEIIRIS